MSSTNKTPNLGLCQWVETDPFLREDMNGDFAKIDEAFDHVISKRLFSVTVSSATASLLLDFSDIDMDQYAELMLYFRFSNNSKYMRVNGVSTNNYITAGSTPDKISLVFPSYQLNFGPEYLYCNSVISTSGYSLKRTIFPSLESLEIFGSSESNGLRQGDRITVWGVRR